MKIRNQCTVSSCFLCTHCGEGWKELIGLKKKTLFFKKGKPVFREGEKVKGIYFIFSGSVKVHKEWAGKKELIIRFEKSGGVIGHRGLGAVKVYPVSATALEDSKICFIENDFFETSLTNNPSLTYQFMQLYADELQKAELRMRNLALMEVKGRIAEAILELSKVFGTGKNNYIAVPVSRQDIAAFAGTTYETVFRFLRTLIQNKIISTSGKSIRVNNPEKLKKFIEHTK
ncbi:MAG: Crp/Fnr family transcriptional regulator [Bacteroidetes bacterium]|nr:Crp/Fnr family transcriptional regulator [Bacteroidota bacterium]